MVLLAQGIGPHEVARWVRAAVGAVYRWHNAWLQGGEAALAAKPVPGAPRKWLDQPREQWLHLLMQGARANGFPHELWTLNRMAAVIQVHFGVRYHPAHVWKLLRHLGWSCQVPERRALQRDEAVITHGKRDTWPAIKKVQRLGAPLVFLDESGCRLIPTRRRTWAPTGQTPIIPYSSKHDRLSTLAALTVSPKRQHLGLYLHGQPQNFQAVDVAEFLRALLRHLRGPILLRWDRGSIPRGPAIEAVRQSHPRLHVEEFPAYAPELNPTEQVWNDFKGHTANCLRRDPRDLRRNLRTNTRRVCRSHAKRRSFILASDLPSPPWPQYPCLC